jgi:uncharacterized protein YprB with RNaseH-like and TPR domain
MRYVLDIETTGLPEAAEYATEPVSAPSNWKDPDKIAAYIAEKQADQINRAGLDLDLCRVVAVGLQRDGAVGVQVMTAGDEEEERGLLTALWSQLLKVQHPVLIGFNHVGFDLPVLMRRSQYLNVAYPRLSLDKYRTPHIDIMAHLTWHGLVRARSLKFYARRFGIPCEDTVKGADIQALVEAGNWDRVISHVTSDVELTAALARRIGLLAELPEPVAAA